jgi:hypothetical protein
MKEKLRPKPSSVRLESAPSSGPLYIRPNQIPEKYGLSRSHAFIKIGDGSFESILVKHPGAKRGLRLVKVESIRRYLASFEVANA